MSEAKATIADLAAVPQPSPADAGAVLAALGGVAYSWTVASDQLAWGENAAEVFGADLLARMASGRDYAAVVDPSSPTGQRETILAGAGADEGAGVPYEIEYALLPEGAGEGKPRLIVEDVGRWFAGADGKPARAGGIVRLVNQRHERGQRLAFLSRYDDLTGYFNRAHLLATLGGALEQAKRARAQIAFMIVAVDNFRAINDAYGFEVADQVFAAVAQRVRAELREGDAIGRYSGNKLGLLLLNCDEASMQAAAERFHAAVRGSVIHAEGSSLAVTVSIGGVGLPRYGRSVNEGMARAQESLHAARARGNGRFAAFQPSPEREARRRANAAVSSEMVAALRSDQLKLHFQPVVSVTTGEARFHEALLRLERSDGSVTAAHEFIELSEKLGLIRLIDRYALDRVLGVLGRSPAARISINVSGETVGDSEWFSNLATAAARNPGVAGRLIVEITETAVIHNLDEAANSIATLHDLGCKVAIDDFGAGFSSFRHLRDLDIDIVKIAGAFVEKMPASNDDQAFVKALTALARAFDIEVVAEWVEDEATAKLLASFGVDMMQGNYCGGVSADLPGAG